MPRVTVQPPTWWPYAQTVRVDIQNNGDAFYEGALIGRVKKQVPAWFGYFPGGGGWCEGKTRMDVLHELLMAANVAGYGYGPPGRWWH